MYFLPLRFRVSSGALLSFKEDGILKFWSRFFEHCEAHLYYEIWMLRRRSSDEYIDLTSVELEELADLVSPDMPLLRVVDESVFPLLALR